MCPTRMKGKKMDFSSILMTIFIAIATLVIVLVIAFAKTSRKIRKSPWYRKTKRNTKKQISPPLEVPREREDRTYKYYDDDDDGIYYHDARATTCYHIGDDSFEEDSTPIYHEGEIIHHHGQRYIVTQSEQVWGDGEGREEGYSVTAVPYDENLTRIERSRESLEIYDKPSDGSPFGVTSFSAKEYGWGTEEGVSIVKYFGPSLSTLVIPEAIDGKPVLAIGEGVFTGKLGFDKILLPDTIMKIGERAFAYNPRLERITLPKSLRAIDRRVFENCIALKKIVIPDSVTVIPQEVFMGCSNLERVVLPLNLDHVLPGAFTGCNRLKSLQISEKAKNFRRDNLPYVKIERLK